MISGDVQLGGALIDLILIDDAVRLSSPVYGGRRLTLGQNQRDF